MATPAPTASQREAIRFFVENQSSPMLITGDPGTGKSFLVNSFRRICDSQGKRHSMVAPRGAAAFVGGGETIHRRLGVLPHGKAIWENATEMRTCLWRGLAGRLGGGETSARAVARREFWAGLDVLFVDEVFLVEAGLLAMLDLTARTIRSSDAPLGGVRAILVGDAYQMAPRGSSGAVHAFRPVRLGPPPREPDSDEEGDSDGDCDGVATLRATGHVQAELWPWAELAPVPFVLRENMRQEGDAQRVFREALGLMRGTPIADMPAPCQELLRSRCVPAEEVRDKYTLYYNNADTEAHNRRVGAECTGEELAFLEAEAVLEPETPEPEAGANPLKRAAPGLPPAGWRRELEAARDEVMERLFSRRRARGDKGRPGLSLRMGATVMLLCNQDVAAGAYRGAVGTVLGLERGKEGAPALAGVRVRLRSGSELVVTPMVETVTRAGAGTARVTYWPLGHGHAGTYDSVQGMTLDEVVCAVTPGMPAGMLLMGASRVRTAESLWFVANVNEFNRDQTDPWAILCGSRRLTAVDPWVEKFSAAMKADMRAREADAATLARLFPRRAPVAPGAAGCVVCAAPPALVFRPCGHVAACRECWRKATDGGVSTCLVCAQTVARADRAVVCVGAA